MTDKLEDEIGQMVLLNERMAQSYNDPILCKSKGNLEELSRRQREMEGEVCNAKSSDPLPRPKFPTIKLDKNSY